MKTVDLAMGYGRGSWAVHPMLGALFSEEGSLLTQTESQRGKTHQRAWDPSLPRQMGQ